MVSAPGPTGQRKLIRPTLPAKSLTEHRNGPFHSKSEGLTVHTHRPASHAGDSHAEAFYFQKQMQSQTRMVVVLENGERMEGMLEWYDHCSIKLHGTGPRRHIMIYKSGIKYLYKAEEKSKHSIMQ